MNTFLSGRSKTEIALISLVMFLSLLNIFNELAGNLPLNYFSVFVSFTGIAGCILLNIRHRFALKLLHAWAVAQLVYILFDGAPVWDVAQVLSFNMGFTFSLRTGGVLEFGVNPAALLPFYLIWKLKQADFAPKNYNR